MLRAYMQSAMNRAKYEILPEDNTFYGEISDCPGVFSNAPSLEGCRQELEEVLEDWIFLRLHRGLVVPEIDGIELVIKEVA